MRVCFDSNASRGQLTGLGVYVRRLRQALEEAGPCDIQIDFIEPLSRRQFHTPGRLFWENVVLPARAVLSGADLLHVPAFAPPWVSPKPAVVTVHDLIGMAFPNQMGRASRFYWGWWLPRAARNARFLIADSEHTKRDLISRLGINEKRIRVIYPSGHEGFRRAAPDEILQACRKLGIRGRYFLAVGTLEPRKNLEGAVRAFSRFIESSKDAGDYQLVITGSVNFAHGRFARLLKEKFPGDPGRIVFTGYVDEETLIRLYSGARAFLFPSFYEGFGLPVLEAMACRTPVIASRRTSLAEVGGEAARYVDPEDTGEMARALQELASDDRLREGMIAKGMERLRAFSWRRTALETLEVYRKIGG